MRHARGTVGQAIRGSDAAGRRSLSSWDVLVQGARRGSSGRGSHLVGGGRGVLAQEHRGLIRGGGDCGDAEPCARARGTTVGSGADAQFHSSDLIRPNVPAAADALRPGSYWLYSNARGGHELTCMVGAAGRGGTPV